MSPSQSHRLSNWPPAARLLQHRRRPAGVRGRPTNLWQKAGHPTGGRVGGALIYQIWRMKENLIELERVRAIQETLRGFSLDEVINSKEEFYTDHRISVGQLGPNRGEGDNEG
ncbi:hypothetical protein C2845_PM16G02380 [Panicum miliaceum]|uniref:Uncharacterized protein n=1 Tax=Panicum miliaceum TaxID=4540 RepID=A0A3L6PY21_PANMI|nr:hypothetical protein C2845_PM16G02380 [Panicum miliaceum]